MIYILSVIIVVMLGGIALLAVLLGKEKECAKELTNDLGRTLGRKGIYFFKHRAPKAYGVWRLDYILYLGMVETMIREFDTDDEAYNRMRAEELFENLNEE